MGDGGWGESKRDAVQEWTKKFQPRLTISQSPPTVTAFTLSSSCLFSFDLPSPTHLRSCLVLVTFRVHCSPFDAMGRLSSQDRP